MCRQPIAAHMQLHSLIPDFYNHCIKVHFILPGINGNLSPLMWHNAINTSYHVGQQRLADVVGNFCESLPLLRLPSFKQALEPHSAIVEFEETEVKDNGN